MHRLKSSLVDKRPKMAKKRQILRFPFPRQKLQKMSLTLWTWPFAFPVQKKYYDRVRPNYKEEPIMEYTFEKKRLFSEKKKRIFLHFRALFSLFYVIFSVK